MGAATKRCLGRGERAKAHNEKAKAHNLKVRLSKTGEKMVIKKVRSEDCDEDKIRLRLHDFHTETKPVMKHYNEILKVIDCTRHYARKRKENVWNEIQDILEKK